MILNIGGWVCINPSLPQTLTAYPTPVKVVNQLLFHQNECNGCSNNVIDDLGHFLSRFKATRKNLEVEVVIIPLVIEGLRHSANLKSKKYFSNFRFDHDKSIVTLPSLLFETTLSLTGTPGALHLYHIQVQGLRRFYYNPTLGNILDTGRAFIRGRVLITDSTVSVSLGTPSILVTKFLVKSPTKSPIKNYKFFCFKSPKCAV